MDLAILLLRLWLASLLAVHAGQKSLGWFRGPGLSQSVAVFTRLGHVPAAPMVVLAALSELVASLLMAAGLGTPLGATIAAGTLLVAGHSQSRVAGAVSAARGGGEYALALAGLAVAVAASGGGRWSLDRALGAPWAQPDGPTSVVLLLGCLLVAGAAALPPVRRAGRIRSIGTAPGRESDSRP